MVNADSICQESLGDWNNGAANDRHYEQTGSVSG
jgi:hypothetical protein